MRIIFWLLFYSVFLNAQWHWQNPNQHAIRIVNIQFADTSTGFVTGFGGKILKTSNSGNEWKEINSPCRQILFNIQFVNEKIGWAKDNTTHTLAKTTNGGKDWFNVCNLNQDFLTCFYFLNELEGYAGFPFGLKKTTDGGETWHPNPVIWGHIFKINFINRNIGFAVTEFGMYKTTNGGQNWVYSSFGSEYSFYLIEKIFPADTNNIYLIGDGYNSYGRSQSLYIYSSNGGNTWIKKPLRFFDIYFTSAVDGWACNGKLLKTSNRGETWETLNINADKIVFKGNKSWCTSARIIYHSTDNWKSYTPQIKNLFSGSITRGEAKDSSKVFAIADSTIIGTIDGGKTWKTYYTHSGFGLNKITFKGDEIWVAGHYFLLHSTNLGITWKKKVFSDCSFTAVQFTGKKVGFAAGNNGFDVVLYKTTDSGVTWNLFKTFSEDNTLKKLLFTSPTEAWLFSYFNIRRTTDGGDNWDLVYNGIFYDFAVSGDTLWGTKSHQIFRSIDGGKSWDSVKVSLNHSMIQFVNSKVGFASEFDSWNVLKTTDGGITWIDLEYPAFNSIFAHTFVNENLGWVFGREGIILKYDLNNITNITDNLESKTDGFFISENYPNPFNPSTKINYSLPIRSNVIIKIFDITGREIKELVKAVQDSGTYTISFDAMGLPSGVYLCRIQAGSFNSVKKLLLIK